MSIPGATPRSSHQTEQAEKQAESAGPEGQLQLLTLFQTNSITRGDRKFALVLPTVRAKNIRRYHQSAPPRLVFCIFNALFWGVAKSKKH